MVNKHPTALESNPTPHKHLSQRRLAVVAILEADLAVEVIHLAAVIVLQDVVVPLHFLSVILPQFLVKTCILLLVT